MSNFIILETGVTCSLTLMLLVSLYCFLIKTRNSLTTYIIVHYVRCISVAERVLQMPTLVLNEATLTVRPKEHISSEHSTTDDTDYQRNEDPATAERAEIQSVSSGISFECFEDEKQDQSRSDDDIATLGDSGENTHGTPLEPGWCCVTCQNEINL